MSGEHQDAPRSVTQWWVGARQARPRRPVSGGAWRHRRVARRRAHGGVRGPAAAVRGAGEPGPPQRRARAGRGAGGRVCEPGGRERQERRRRPGLGLRPGPGHWHRKRIWRRLLRTRWARQPYGFLRRRSALLGARGFCTKATLPTRDDRGLYR